MLLAPLLLAALLLFSCLLPPLTVLPSPPPCLQDVFEDDVAVHLVMELCEGGSVLDGLKDGEYSERQVGSSSTAGVLISYRCLA